MIIVCERVGLGRKVLHRHPYILYTLRLYESDNQLVLRSPPS